MQKTIVLLSCTASKKKMRCKAVDMYEPSAYYRKALQYAKLLNPDRICILSAEHGLLELDDEIDPYDKTLVNMKKTDINEWYSRVIIQMEQKFDLSRDNFIFLTGIKYRQGLQDKIKYSQCPIANLRIGYVMQKLDVLIKNASK